MSLDLDLATAIARIEQAHNEPEMRDFLLDRLATCDAPRLRRHLSTEMAKNLRVAQEGDR